MKKSILGLLALIIILILAAALFNNFRNTDGLGGPNATTTPVDGTVSGTITLTGKMVCLPHRDSDGPQTLECALGLRADDGSYYGLDMRSADPGGVYNIPTDTRLSVTGTMVPRNSDNEQFWQRYNIKGMIRVEKYRELDKVEATLNEGGQAMLKINDSVTFMNHKVRVWAVTEDSRCPKDAICIQAGRARVGMNVESPSGASTKELEIGQTYTTETISITLDRVDPYPVSTRKTADSEYRIYLTLKKR